MLFCVVVLFDVVVIDDANRWSFLVGDSSCISSVTPVSYCEDTGIAKTGPLLINDEIASKTITRDRTKDNGLYRAFKYIQ